MVTRTFRRLSPWLALSLTLWLTACATSPGIRFDNPAQRAYDAGLMHYNEGDVAAAIEAFREATLRIDGGEFKADVEFQLGRCYLLAGNTLAAVEHFREARRHTRRPLTLFRAWKGSGEAHYQARDFGQAAAAFGESLHHEADRIFLDEVRYKLAVSLRRAGRAAEAAEVFALVHGYTPGPDEPVYGEGDVPRAAVAASGLADGAISPRAEWGARPTRSNFDLMTPIHRVTIHHSAIVSYAESRISVADEIRLIQKLHQDDRQWADIGYHFVIDHGGHVWEGRSLRMQGAHAGNSDLNRGNVGIVLLGNFNEQSVTSPQERALETLILYLMERYQFEPSAVHTHGELKNTECPGRALQRTVDLLRERLESGQLEFVAKAEVRHLVERGETLFSIARRYGVLVKDLRDANAAIDGDRLEAGQEIRVPGNP